MQSLLIVEDDKTLCDGISFALRSDEWEIYAANSLNAAKGELLRSRFDLVILDVNLPDGSGIYLLKQIKSTQLTPVIMLTANDMETDIVSGLEMGADDYITKPFSLAVLRARVNTQFRKASARHNIFKQDDFAFDFDKMLFLKGSSPIELSKTEQKLLRLLIENKGSTMSRAALVDHIWTDGAEYVDENALSVTIKRLRDKLESDPSKPKYIKTIYGIGYTWVAQ